MFDVIARILAFFYSLPVVGGSYGIAIVLLTGAVMILLMPLTIRATRSTIKMQEVQPKLKELQKKHKDDKQTLNAELMALYQENGINPVGGCLPMLAQLPVFLVLFNVLRGLSRRVSETPYYAISEKARSLVGGPSIPGETFDPRYLAPDSEMYIDLSQDSEMAFGPFDLAQEARDVIQNDLWAGIPYVLLILFVVATSFYQQRQVSSRRNGSIGMNPQQEMILKVLPLASGIWSFVFPTGLVIYWATSNVFRIGQQAYITRAFYGHKAAEEAAEDEVEAPSGRGETVDDGGDGDASRRTPRSVGRGAKGGAARAGASGSKRPKKDGQQRSPGRKPAPSAPAANKGSEDGSRNGRSPAGGDSSINGSGAADRQEAWAKRRQERARAKSGSKTRSDQSSRVTPKGTKPGSSKKKRKR